MNSGLIPLTVSEMIEQLKGMPPNAMLWIHPPCTSPRPITLLKQYGNDVIEVFTDQSVSECPRD